jgi:hypothetical protein
VGAARGEPAHGVRPPYVHPSVIGSRVSPAFRVFDAKRVARTARAARRAARPRPPERSAARALADTRTPTHVPKRTRTGTAHRTRPLSDRLRCILLRPRNTRRRFTKKLQATPPRFWRSLARTRRTPIARPSRWTT